MFLVITPSTPNTVGKKRGQAQHPTQRVGVYRAYSASGVWYLAEMRILFGTPRSLNHSRSLAFPPRRIMSIYKQQLINVTEKINFKLKASTWPSDQESIVTDRTKEIWTPSPRCCKERGFMLRYQVAIGNEKIPGLSIQDRKVCQTKQTPIEDSVKGSQRKPLQ